MPYGEYAECPKCGKKAYNKDQIEKFFGYRALKNGKIIPQSWCRNCRSSNGKSNGYGE